MPAPRKIGGPLVPGGFDLRPESETRRRTGCIDLITIRRAALAMTIPHFMIHDVMIELKAYQDVTIALG